MKVTLNRIENYHVSVSNNTGHEIHLDNKSASPQPQGASPMELLLMGIAGCSSIDIVAILNKQKLDPTSLRMEVEGHREEGKVPSLFDKIHVQVFIDGDIPEEKAQRAAKLSFEKYCSVSKTLEATAEITYQVIINGNKL